MPPPRSKRRCLRNVGKVSPSSKDGDNLAKVPSTKGRGDPKEAIQDGDHLSHLSLEILCHILGYLPLCDIMRVESLCRRLNEAVTMHLQLLSELDFTEGQIFGCMPSCFNDVTFVKFLSRCPELIYIYGLNPKVISKRRQRGLDTLSVPGVIEALQMPPKLKGVETCDIFLLEALLADLPHLEVLRIFQNRTGCFPIPPSNKLELTRNARITTLNLTGVVVSELPRMDFLKQLSLRWVKFTNPHPFRDFGVPLLRSFVMNNCAGPNNALKYVPLVTGLAAARSLTRLEMVRVPFLGGLIQHVVEDSWRMHGFRQLTRAVFGTCKHALEVDLGYLAITCAQRLEELAVQPSLTKDSLFVSLKLADVDFPKFDTLHLGFVDDFPEPGKWTNEQLVSHGLADITENPSMLTDIGMRAVGQAFPHMKRLAIYNCPHLHFPTLWLTSGALAWSSLKELHLRRCHAVRLPDFCNVLPLLLSLETLILEHMFREPPKGCSRVGLSAGTGLGVSSALVSNTGQDANQDPGNNNQPGVVPANPGPVPNHPGIIPANHVVDNNDQDDENMDSEEEYDDLVWVPDDDDDEDEEVVEVIPQKVDQHAEGNNVIDEGQGQENGNQESKTIEELKKELAPVYKDHDSPAVTGNGEKASTSRRCSSPQPGPSFQNNSYPVISNEEQRSSHDSFDAEENVTSSHSPKPNSKVDDAHLSGTSGTVASSIPMAEGTETSGNEKSMNNVNKCNSPDGMVMDDEHAQETARSRVVNTGLNSDGAIEHVNCSKENKTDCGSTESHSDADMDVNYENDSFAGTDEMDMDDDENDEVNDRHDHSSSVTASLKSEQDSPVFELDGDLPNVSMELSHAPQVKYDSRCKHENDLNDCGDSSGKLGDNADLSSPCPAAPLYCMNGSPKNATMKEDENVTKKSASETDCPPSCSTHDNDIKIKEEAEISLAEPSTSQAVSLQPCVSNSQTETPYHEGAGDKRTNAGRVGKGKSLRGKKKGLLKSSSSTACVNGNGNSNDQVNQSCQAVSEEIRETTKKVDDISENASGSVENKNSVESAVPHVSKASQDQSNGHQDPGEIPLQSFQPTPSTSAEVKPNDALNTCKSEDPKTADESCKLSEAPKTSCAEGNSANLNVGLPKPPVGEPGKSQKLKGRRVSGKRNSGASRRSGRKKPTMCDQATSTSDPVIEEDHVQILTVTSSSLISITLRHVGITDLVVQSCPKLNSLTGSACRVLKNVQIKEAPRVLRVSFAQCRKLRHNDLIDEICKQSAEKNRVIFLRPMGNYDPVSLNRQLFQSPKYAYHMCLIHDNSPDPEGTLHNRVRVSSWTDLLANVNFDLLKFQEFKEACRSRNNSKKYPWGRYIYTMTGDSEDGSNWDLVTDIPWLRPLAQGAYSRPLCAQDAAEGLYCPRAHGHKNTEACLDALVEDIMEAQEEMRALFMHFAIVYINTCDLKGQPTSDLYI